VNFKEVAVRRAGSPTPVLGVLAIAQLMGVLDFSIVNVAMPSGQHEFQLTPPELQWIVSAYAVTLGGLMLLGGRLTDFLARNRSS
jgi:MFS family permease